jgi:hypothetical protein
MDKATGGEIGLEIVDNMSTLTGYRINEQGLKNAELNLKYLPDGSSLKELRDAPPGRTDSALVVSAGPSLRLQDPARLINQSSYDGTIICTDSSMLYCLRNNIIPDLVVTLDPHSKRIVRWFGDTHLSEQDLATDDYFSRQDLDRSFKDELEVNQEIIGLLDRHGHEISIALSTSSPQDVVRRVLDIGMKVYWWNPMYDDPGQTDSITRKLYRMNKLPCVNAGGNVGSACWMMAQAVLGKSHVGLVGMDFSYYEDTPYRNTQYYYEAVNLVGEENLDSIYIRVFNPFINKWFYTDPAYMWYRNSFLEMAADSDCVTYNCTEGGILFGDNIRFTPLNTFLEAETSGS